MLPHSKSKKKPRHNVTGFFNLEGSRDRFISPANA